jgi:hypothetical protein
MVAAVRRGASQRKAATRFGVALCTVQRWVGRADGQRLDRVEWDGLPRRPKRTRRTRAGVERRVLVARRYLKERSALGEFGAVAIREYLEAQGRDPCPSIRTIGRILQRHGAVDGRRRTRRPAPVRGWYLPRVAAEEAELDCVDTIEDLIIRGGPQVTVLTGISLHGGLPVAWPVSALTAQLVVEFLLGHWGEVGRPSFAQFDNDTRFQGPHQHAGAIGRVIRVCLSLGVTPVFVPPRETGFQAAIESFNGRWQAKVWSRFQHRSLRILQDRSTKYIEAARERATCRIDSAPPRRPLPKRWRLDLQARPRGTIVYIRRTSEEGRARFLGRTFLVDRHWCHRLLRAEVDLTREQVRFYALRRREPTEQPLLKQVSYKLPRKPFRG